MGTAVHSCRLVLALELSNTFLTYKFSELPNNPLPVIHLHSVGFWANKCKVVDNNSVWTIILSDTGAGFLNITSNKYALQSGDSPEYFPGLKNHYENSNLKLPVLKVNQLWLIILYDFFLFLNILGSNYRVMYKDCHL